MKILLIGGTGTIGAKVADRLHTDHNLIIAGHTSGDVQTDITKPESIKALFEEVGAVDAVISTTGAAPMQPLDQTTNEHFMEGVKSKMMGQINIALTAMNYLHKNGSVTLTSGILAHDPIPQGAVLATINNAINGFVIGAYGEFLKKGFRINAVSPALVEDSVEALGSYFPGHTPAKMPNVVNGYIKSLSTFITGEIINIA